VKAAEVEAIKKGMAKVTERWQNADRILKTYGWYIDGDKLCGYRYE